MSGTIIDQTNTALASLNSNAQSINSMASSEGQAEGAPSVPFEQDAEVGAAYAQYGDYQFADSNLLQDVQDVAQAEENFALNAEEYPSPPYPLPDYTDFYQTTGDEEFNVTNFVYSLQNADDDEGIILPQTSDGPAVVPTGISSTGGVPLTPTPTTGVPASSITDSDVLTNGDGSVLPDTQRNPIPAVLAGPPAGAISTDPNVPVVDIDGPSTVASDTNNMATMLGTGPDVVATAAGLTTQQLASGLVQEIDSWSFLQAIDKVPAADGAAVVTNGALGALPDVATTEVVAGTLTMSSAAAAPAGLAFLTFLYGAVQQGFVQGLGSLIKLVINPSSGAVLIGQGSGQTPIDNLETTYVTPAQQSPAGTPTPTGMTISQVEASAPQVAMSVATEGLSLSANPSGIQGDESTAMSQIANTGTVTPQTVMQTITDTVEWDANQIAQQVINQYPQYPATTPTGNALFTGVESGLIAPLMTDLSNGGATLGTDINNVIAPAVTQAGVTPKTGLTGQPVPAIQVPVATTTSTTTTPSLAQKIDGLLDAVQSLTVGAQITQDDATEHATVSVVPSLDPAQIAFLYAEFVGQSMRAAANEITMGVTNDQSSTIISMDNSAMSGLVANASAEQGYAEGLGFLAGLATGGTFTPNDAGFTSFLSSTIAAAGAPATSVFTAYAASGATFLNDPNGIADAIAQANKALA